MDIVCPECAKCHEVAGDKVPGLRFNAICRGCGLKFGVEIAACPSCGVKNQKGHPCPCRAQALEEPLAGDEEDKDSAVPASQREERDGEEEEALEPRQRSQANEVREEHRLRFVGSGQEFFRIWIVNLFLTIMTLGIYGAWAKVRTRQYFYSHTTCAGESFDYLADPMIILRGMLIVGGGFLFYMLTNAFTPLVSSLVALVFTLLFPLLVFKSLRFYARNSAYRNIRFHFLGTLDECYITYLLLPFLLPFTLGLIFPYWAYRRKKYFFNNVAFGNQSNVFSATPADFYKIYIKSFVIIVLPLVLVFALFAGISGVAMGLDNSSFEHMSAGFVTLLVLLYLGFIVAAIFAQQYVYAKVTNYCWECSTLGTVTFRSTLTAAKLMWIRMTNIMALIISAGLLYPWTKVRERRYILENLSCITSQGLDGFSAGKQDAEDALGEAAMDFFDFEVGL